MKVEMELKRALEIAEGIVTKMEPVCQHVHIAGSCRRRSPIVGDVEIVALPKPKITRDVLGEERVIPRPKAFKDVVEGLGKILKGSVNDGRQLQINIGGVVNLDLFLPEPDDYFRLLAYRTGPGDYSRHVLAVGCLKRGWCGSTNAGLRLIKQCYQNGKKEWMCPVPNAAHPPVWASEEEFFSWIGVKWVEPWLRKV